MSIFSSFSSPGFGGAIFRILGKFIDLVKNFFLVSSSVLLLFIWRFVALRGFEEFKSTCDLLPLQMDGRVYKEVSLP